MIQVYKAYKLFSNRQKLPLTVGLSQLISFLTNDLLQACRERNVDCIVAPYEADSQLAFLNRWASNNKLFLK
jgi:hypothetical protein